MLRRGNRVAVQRQSIIKRILSDGKISRSKQDGNQWQNDETNKKGRNPQKVSHTSRTLSSTTTGYGLDDLTCQFFHQEDWLLRMFGWIGRRCNNLPLIFATILRMIHTRRFISFGTHIHEHPLPRRDKLPKGSMQNRNYSGSTRDLKCSRRKKSSLRNSASMCYRCSFLYVYWYHSQQ